MQKNDTIQTEYDLKVRDFVLVGADSVETINAKIVSIDNETKQLKERFKEATDAIDKEAETKKSVLKDALDNDLKVKKEQKDILLMQKESARYGIEEKIKELTKRKLS